MALLYLIAATEEGLSVDATMEHVSHEGPCLQLGQPFYHHLLTGGCQHCMTESAFLVCTLSCFDCLYQPPGWCCCGLCSLDAQDKRNCLASIVVRGTLGSCTTLGFCIDTLRYLPL